MSVVMPLHNSEPYIYSSIQSVLFQTYENWELLIVDDCSSDGSPEIIKECCRQDKRIKIYKTEKPSGSPTLPRNLGTEKAKGRYITFLDSDDLWLPTKLEHQLKTMDEHPEALLIYSNYRKMDTTGKPHRSVVTAPPRTNYRKLLNGNVIGCLTALYDTKKTGKLYFPYCGHEDYVLWLSVLRNGGVAVNTNTEEAQYRLSDSSVSSNKFRAMRWQWQIYNKVEGLNLLESVYYFANYAIRALNKRRK